MSDDTQVKVEVAATTDKLTAGMQLAANSVKSGVAEIKEHLAGMNAGFEQITKGFALFTAALAGGSALKEFVKGALDSTKEAVVLGKTLGITATEASYFKSALAQVGISTDVVATAAKKITMALLKNEDGFKSLGVATRDHDGHLRNSKDLMLDTNDALRAFKEGTDRNIEGMKIYGRSWSEVAPLVSKFKGETEETRKEAEALNLVVGQEAVSAMADYKVSQIGVKEVMEGITNTIGREIIPRLAELGNWFKSIGPDAVAVTRVAMQGYLAVQDSIKDSIKAVWSALSTSVRAIVGIFTDAFGSGGSTITAMEFFQNCVKVVQIAFIGFRIGVELACASIVGGVNNMIIIFRGLTDMLSSVAMEFENFGRLVKAAFTLDWDGVKDAAAKVGTYVSQSFVDTGEKIKANFGATFEKMADIARKGGADIAAALDKDLSKGGKVTAIKEKEGGERSNGADASGKDDPDKRMKLWEAALLEKKTLYMRENDMREMSLADETAYWQAIVRTLDVGDKALGAAKKKAAESQFAEMKEAAKKKQGLELESIAFDEKIQTGAVDKQKIAADQQLALGIIDAKQRIALEQEFADDIYKIQLNAIVARNALLKLDETRNAVEIAKNNDAIRVLQQKHENDVLAIKNKAQLEATKNARTADDAIKAGFNSAIAGMLNGTTTFVGGLKALFKSVEGAFANLVANMATEWLMTMIKSRVSQVTTAVANIMSQAAVGGAAAFASTAAIPIVGPGLAPAAGAAAYSGISSFAGLASARNGFDIPSGLNPVTQLHEREMVLPQKQADAVRDMADNGGTGGGVHLHVHAVDAKSVERLFKDNGRHIASALQGQMRNFAVKGAV